MVVKSNFLSVTDGCPVADTCVYNALKCRDEYRFPFLRRSLTVPKRHRLLRLRSGSLQALGGAVCTSAITQRLIIRFSAWSLKMEARVRLHSSLEMAVAACAVLSCVDGMAFCAAASISSLYRGRIL